MSKKSLINVSVVVAIIVMAACGTVFIMNDSANGKETKAPNESKLSVKQKEQTKKKKGRKKRIAKNKTQKVGKVSINRDANGDVVVDVAKISDDIDNAMFNEDYDTVITLVKALLAKTTDKDKIIELIDILGNTGKKGLNEVAAYINSKDKEIHEAAFDAWKREVDMLDASNEKTGIIKALGKTVVENADSDADTVQGLIDTLFDAPEKQAVQTVLEWIYTANSESTLKVLKEDLAFKTGEEFSSDNLSRGDMIREAEAMVKKYIRELD